MYVSEELLQNYVHCLITLCILLLLEHIYFIVLLKHEWQLDAKTIFYVVGHNVITNYNCIICRVINDSIKSASINEMSLAALQSQMLNKFIATMSSFPFK